MNRIKLSLTGLFTIFVLITINAQDDCYNAVHIQMDYYSTCGLMALENVELENASPFTDAPDPGCGNYNAGTNDMWYTVMVPAGVTELAFHAINPPAFMPFVSDPFSPGMAIYSGSCGNLTLLDCFSDQGGMLGHGEIRFEVVDGLTPGQVLYIRVWDQDNNDNPFWLAASVETHFDEHYCDTPAELTSGGCNILAPQGEIQSPNDCGWSSTDNTVYYHFTVYPEDEQPYTIEVENGECWNNESGSPIPGTVEIQLAVYSWNGVDCDGIGGSPLSDPPNNTTYWGCENGTGTQVFSENLPPGQYVLAMDGFSSMDGWSLCTYGISADFIEEELITDLGVINATCGEAGSATVYIISSCTDSPSINWSNGATGTSVDNLDPGSYSVTISDGDDCEDVIHEFVIEDNDNFSVTIVSDGDECSETVTLTAQVEGADPGDVDFTWNTTPPQSSQSIEVSESGNFSVNAEYGTCDDSDQTNVTVMDVPDPTITPAGPFCDGDPSVTLEAATDGGTWSGPGITNPSTGTFNPSQANIGENEITYTVGEGECEASDNIIINVYDTPDATIDPAGPFCANDAQVTLTAASTGGTWSGPGITSPANGTFDPSQANSGDNNISYQVGIEGCQDSDNIVIEVIDGIIIQNFSDNVCSPDLSEYYVTFSVIYEGGESASFYVDDGGGDVLHNSNYSGTFPNTESYNLVITDTNGCGTYQYTGSTDCGCLTFAGTMSSLETLHLCVDECTDVLAHNGDQELNTGDVFEFILHDGSYPGNILARNDTPEFCFADIAGLNFNQTYYVSAIAGPDNGSGHVDQSGDCYSQSAGAPVIWYDDPIAFVTSNNTSVCGQEVVLNAMPPQDGNTGTWSASAGFTPINGTNFNSPSISVLVYDYGSVTFEWTVSNGVCTGSDQVVVNFLQKPTAYAGENQTVCGSQATLEAIPSIAGTTGQWTGPGSFSPSNEPITEVSVSSYGQHTFNWRETNGGLCWDEDVVTVTFIQEPNPTITTDSAVVCGSTYSLSVSNVGSGNTGSWTAYEDGDLLVPAPPYTSGSNSPTTNVSIGSYTGDYRIIEFVWTETNQQGGVQCSAEASIVVTFAKAPSASVGPQNAAEVCGNEFTFSADITGSEFAIGEWVSTNVSAEFDDRNDPQANVEINVPGSYGDSAYVEVPFIWVMDNQGCTDIDTMWVTFYRQPVANAGLDNEVCGFEYNLGAVFSLPESSNYSPQGTWSTYSYNDGPVDGVSADIQPQNGDSVFVSVSTVGEWVFQFRESNANATFCFDTDTVRIKFLEKPIVDAGEDKHICGTSTQLEGTSAGFSGTWLPNGTNIEDFSNPTSDVSTSTYGWIDFIWTESNEFCTARDTVSIRFWRVPQANILTDQEDSTTCGLTFPHLRANAPASGVTGFWWNLTDPDPVYGDVNSNNTNVTVSTYGYHDFYWIAANGPTFQPDFCTDTAGPLTIHFIEIPEADAGGDVLFCGYSGDLNANPSVGTGVWSTPSSELITFEDINDPNTEITSQVLTGSANPYFNVIWTEDNTNGCTDRDTIKVRFARIPKSDINIVPPKCFGEPATLSAKEDSLQEYSWNFYSGIIDSISPENSEGGIYEYFVYWTNQDTAHQVSLVATNFWGCQSLITIDTVFEPKIPDFDMEIVGDTCLLGKGGVILLDTLGTNAFYWLDSTVGPPVNTPVTAVYNIPEGEYGLRARYRTENQDWYNYYIQTFGNANCTDTIYFDVEPIGMLEAIIEIPPQVFLEDLVAPEAEVIFNNLSDYGGVRRRCIWNFGDGNTLTSCDEQVEHTYTEPNCYEPFLIIMNRDLQECRDTAFIDPCIEIDNESSLEIPNVFTPNGDGINDFFQVKAETLRSFQGYIVNRWGTVVFEWSNWQDEEAGWDGKLPGGTNASPGVYYFIINAVGMDDFEYEEQGALHLFRN